MSIAFLLYWTCLSIALVLFQYCIRIAFVVICLCARIRLVLYSCLSFHNRVVFVLHSFCLPIVQYCGRVVYCVSSVFAFLCQRYVVLVLQLVVQEYCSLMLYSEFVGMCWHCIRVIWVWYQCQLVIRLHTSCIRSMSVVPSSCCIRVVFALHAYCLCSVFVLLFVCSS